MPDKKEESERGGKGLRRGEGKERERKETVTG